jgi:hypothetical protein
MSWPEEECVEYLADERRRFAWVMRRYGGMTPAQADAAALERYPYEPPDAPFRDLIFHDESWHWAMLKIHGQDYPRTHPELVHPPAEYRALD